MATNKEKLIASAQKLVEKGQYDKAVKEYLRVVQEDDNDVRVWLKIGDLHAKLQRNREAAETYQRVAQFYSEKGHYLKAVAVYKQILKIEPRLVDVNQRLAEMYKQLGLISDAMQQYELVAAHFHKEGRPRDALAALKQIVELDPENVASRIKLAELYSKEAMNREAIDEFSRAADGLRTAGRVDDYMKVAERLLFHAPDNRPIGRELARLYVDKGDPRRALSKLQVVLKGDARDSEALSLLASAFEMLGQATKSVSVLKELARIHRENGSQFEHDETLRRILKLQPSDLSAQAKLQPPRERAPEPQRERAQAAEPQLGRQTIPEPVPAPQMEPGPTFLEEASEESTDSSTGDDEEIGKILTETDVYLKYGLHQKALEHVQKIFAHQPDHVEGREKLKAIYVTLGRIDEAVAELLMLVKRVGRNSPEGESYLQEILVLQPGNTRARNLLSQGGSQLTPGPERLPKPIRTVLDEPPANSRPLDLGGGAALDQFDELSAEELDLEDSAVLAVEELVQDPYGAALDAAIDTNLPGVPGDSDEFPLDVDSRPLHMARSAEADADPFAPGPEPVSMPSIARSSPPPAVGTPSSILDEIDAPAPPRADVTRPEGGTLEDDLDEADFFIQQSMFEDARDILGGLLDRYPSHPLVTAKLRDVEALEHGASPDALQALIDPPPEIDRHAARSDEEPADYASTPLDEAVSDDEPLPLLVSSGDDGPEPTAVGDVFALARKNVVERGVTPEDYETHYDLGIAYKEMGLTDDAISEFTLVMQDQAREVQCHLMLGLCYAEKGLMTDAISQFKEGLYVEQIQDREQMALYYELGQAYERLRDGREALYYYEKVIKRDPQFRDVERRVQFLRGDGVPESTEFGGPGEGEVDAAFDGLLDEGSPPVNEARGSK